MDAGKGQNADETKVGGKRGAWRQLSDTQIAPFLATGRAREERGGAGK